MSKSILKD